MEELFGPTGVVVGSAAFLIQTLVAAWFVSKKRHLFAAYKRLRRVEPRYLQSLDWILAVEEWAALNGHRKKLPKLPDFILEARASEDNSALGLDEDEIEGEGSSGGTPTAILEAVRRRVGSGPQDPEA